MATDIKQAAKFSTRQRQVLTGSIVLLAVAALLWIIFGIKHYVANINNGTLKLTVVPADATLTIDNDAKTTSSSLSLSPGTHIITFTRTDFVTKTITVNIFARQTAAQTVVLRTADQAGIDYLSNNPDQGAIADGVGSAQVAANGQIISANNPLINLLPYHGADYDVDYGISQAHPTNRDAVAIYISADTDAGRAHALAWIRAQGFDPAGYEIIYQGFGGSSANPTQDTSGIIPDGD